MSPAPHSHNSAGSLNVVVLLPGQHLDAIDALAKARKTTRSALVREAVALYLSTEGVSR